jgi:integrase/recombinase XerD
METLPVYVGRPLPEAGAVVVSSLWDHSAGGASAAGASPSGGAAGAGAPVEVGSLVNQAANDREVVAMWLHGRSPHTQRGYAAAVERFVLFVEKPLHAVTVRDVQEFADSLRDLAPSSRKAILAAVRSLFSYAHKRVGYLGYNVGAPVELPKLKETVGERILTESEVHRMLALSTGRDGVLLRLLYCSGVRVSEVCGISWRDAVEREDAGQITVFGKGSKTRPVLLSRETWRELVRLREGLTAAGHDGPGEPVFRSARRNGKGTYHLSTVQVWRIIRAAARRAGISAGVSPHWLRHSHASHALDRGAAIHLVQATLGHASVATTGIYLHARPSDSSGRYLSV